jgi:hypothetical protein
VFGSIFFVLVGLRTQVVKEHLIPYTYLPWLQINENLETSPYHIKDSQKVNDAPVTSAQLAARTAAAAVHQNLTLNVTG